MLLAAPAHAADTAGVIVHYKAGTDAAERIDTRQDGDVSFGRQMLLPRTEVVQPDPGVSTAAAVKALEADPDVAFAEPNGVRHALATPNDELFNNEWGLENTGQVFSEPTSQTALNDADVDASAAWDQATGSSSVMVAVVDTGIDATHPDLAPNIWTNPGEIAGNGRDDDGNGLVDDVHGWDFACRDEALTGANLCTGRSSAGDNSPVDANGHGTHVAGTVGARGNDGFGVAGVNWTAGLMSVRVLGADGSGTDADVVDGEAYAGKMGARVVNLSLGANTPLDAERLAMQNAPNTLFVVAAGNSARNNDIGSDFPCNYDLPNILCVAATNRSDTLASFSNFGVQTVDLGAPGVDVASTWPTSIAVDAAHRVKPGSNQWAYESGTSMATPHVAGVAALVLSKDPQLTTAQLRQAILDGVDKVPGLDGRVATGGRLNAAGALAAGDRIASPPPPPPPPPPPVAVASVAPSVAAPAPDATAPVLRLDVARSVRLRSALSHGIVVLAHCSEGCQLTYELLFDARTARRYHVHRTIAHDTGALLSAATDKGTLRLKLPRKARKAKSLHLTLRIRAKDAAGNRVTKTVTLLLRR